jgi:choline dehydrogenase
VAAVELGSTVQDAGQWDYIVVGAGSAGSIVAARLSDDPAKRVLVLEAGPKDSVGLKAFGLGYYFDQSRFEWGYWSQPDPSRNMRSDHWRRGKVVGGTGSINGMNYVRGTRADYDRWAAMGNPGWSADDVMPIFADLERCVPGYETAPDPAIRGMTGPIPIREVHHCHPLTEAFLESAQAVGLPRTADYNGVRQEGVGRGQFNQWRGFRRTSADMLLKPALKRGNIRLLTGAHVHRLEIENRRVTGVRFEHKGTLKSARADRVVLCAGTINTPQIMMLSGVGSAAALRYLGIEVVLDRNRVGRNLMEHPLIRTAFRSTMPTYNPSEGFLQKLGFLAGFLRHGRGPIATPAEGQAFLRTTANQAEPDVQMHFAPLAAIFSGDISASNRSVNILPYPSFSVHINKSYPESRGQISLKSADPKVAPRIDPNLMGDPRDVETLVAALRLLRRIVAAEPLLGMIKEHIEPRPEIVSDADLAKYVRNNASLAYHPAGTCSMGPDDQDVVSPDLKVRGLENLWIADASVMPKLVSGNINAAAMMIGEKLGRQLTSKTSFADTGGDEVIVPPFL